MYAQLRYLDGPAEGRVRVAGRDFITIGRHFESDVPFDAERDLQVSGRHAAIFKQGGGFMVRDLGSSNGTFLNGRRVRGDLPLEPQDVLQFGPSGPRLEFSITDSLPRLGEAERIEPPAEPPRYRRSRARTTERLAIPAPSPWKRWRWALVAVLLGGAVLATRFTQARQRAAVLERERAMLLGRVDDLVTRLGQARSGVAGLAGALEQAGRDAAELRAELAVERAVDLALDSLGAALGEMTQRHQALLRAAEADLTAWSRPAARALAAMVIEGRAGSLRAGTGLTVAARGDTAWIVTARALVVDSAGQPPFRLALSLQGQPGVALGRLVRVSDTADLALVAARVRGGPASAARLGGQLAPGDPVSIVGATDDLAAGRERPAEAVASVATITAEGPSGLGLELYGQRTALGRALVGAAGQVVGLVIDTLPARAASAAAIRAFLAPLGLELPAQ